MEQLTFSAAAKAYVGLIGLIATALLATMGPDGTLGTSLTVISVIASTVVIWMSKNTTPKEEAL